MVVGLPPHQPLLMVTHAVKGSAPLAAMLRSGCQAEHVRQALCSSLPLIQWPLLHASGAALFSACLRQSSAAADVGAGQENMDPHAVHQHASHPGTPEGASKGQSCGSPSPAVLGPRTPANAD